MIDLIVVIICLAFNAIFSAYEMAFVTISNEEIIDLKNEKSFIGNKVLRFKKRTERTLSVIQIGITLVGAIAAAVGGAGVASRMEPYLIAEYNISAEIAEFISMVLVIVPLTYLSVVFGELIPKTIALRFPKPVLIFATTLLDLIDRFLSPIVSFLEWSTSFIVKRLPMSKNPRSEHLSVEIGHLPNYHRRFVHNLVSLKAIRLKNIFKPKEKTIYLNFSDDDSVLEEKISATVYSRFPVIDGDTIVGIFHQKEWDEAKKENKNIPWQGVLRSALHLHEDSRILDAFLSMQEGAYHIAIVVNEQDEFLGMVSLEDILEEIVGDIKDDMDQKRISRLLNKKKSSK